MDDEHFLCHATTMQQMRQQQLLQWVHAICAKSLTCSAACAEAPPNFGQLQRPSCAAGPNQLDEHLHTKFSRHSGPDRRPKTPLFHNMPVWHVA